MLPIPVTREPPSHVLAGLQAIDPRTAVVWWGPAVDVREVPIPGHPGATRPQGTIQPAWLICTFDFAREGNAAAGRSYHSYRTVPLAPDKGESPEAFRRRADLWRQRQRRACLMYAGYVPRFFWFARDLDSELVFAYDEMRWFAEQRFEQLQRQEIRALEQPNTPDQKLLDREEQMRQLVRDTMPAIWKHTFRGRRSVLVPGRAA